MIAGATGICGSGGFCPLVGVNGGTGKSGQIFGEVNVSNANEVESATKKCFSNSVNLGTAEFLLVIGEHQLIPTIRKFLKEKVPVPRLGGSKLLDNV